MTHDDDTFRAQVAAALAGRPDDGGPGGPAEHPTLDELTAFHQGRLDPADAERVRDHLVDCRECFDASAELAELVRAGETGPAEVRNLEEAAAWRGLKPRLSPSKGGRTLPLALAASFLVAALGLGIWAVQQRGENARLHRELARLSQPQPAAILVDLFPEGDVRGAGDGPTPVDWTAADHLTLILHLPESPAAEAYEAEIVDSEDRTRWTGRVHMDAYGTLTLGIPRPFLDAGSYRIDLYAVTGDARDPLESFPLDLANPPESL